MELVAGEGGARPGQGLQKVKSIKKDIIRRGKARLEVQAGNHDI